MPVKAGSTQGSTLSPAGLKGKAVKPVIPICSSLGTCFSLLWSIFIWASLVAQLGKNPPAMQETPVRSLGQEDPLEKGKATHSSILA